VQPFSFDHLTPTEFEEFCFDLLGELGFVNLQWRKGTGLSTSPADRGRDIQCQLEGQDIDGHKSFDTWFVECKHSVKGVSPEKIQSATTWAKAERADKLLIIASNFLSNPAHSFLEMFKNNEKPYFKIKVWQKPDLERLTIGKYKLLRKFKIGDEFPFLTIMHPAHLLYLKSMPFNSFEHFVGALDKLEHEKREKILSWVNEIIIRPRYRRSVTGKERMIDLRIDEVSYEIFKQKGRILAQVLGEPFLVCAVVSWLLGCLFHSGDTTALDEKREDLDSNIRFINGIKRAYEGDPEGDAIGLNCYMDQKRKRQQEAPYLADDNMSEAFNWTINTIQESVKKLHERTQEAYSLYASFCEVVVRDLLVEKLF
jgi:hypothetical protein